MTNLPVIASRHFEPERERLEFAVPEGSTLDFIVEQALGRTSQTELSRVRVSLVTRSGLEIVPRDKWHVTRPKAGVQIVIRAVPGKSILRTVLQILVTVVAVALGQFWIAPLFGSFAGALATAAFTALGNLLINALIPPVRPQDSKEKPHYAISSFRNQFLPDGTIPMVLGRHRFAPPFASSSWTEISGDNQYVRALFCFGYGPLAVTDLKIGDTPFEKFLEIDWELRNGWDDDEPLSVFHQQAFEEQIGSALERRRPRDDYGNIIEGSSAIETPVARFSGSDARRIGILLAFPAGFNKVDGEGNFYPNSVVFRVRYRKDGAGAWTTGDPITIVANKREGFYRQIIIAPAERGRYEVELTRMGAEDEGSTVTERVIWAAIQTFRPEYPVNFDKPLCLLGMRIRATYQLNGALDNISGVVTSVLPDWNAGTAKWVVRITRNPASHFVAILRGPMNAKPVTDDQIDWDAVQDWHEFNTANDLKYDRVHDFAASIEDVLMAVCAAGRATPRHDGKRWSIVIDRRQDLVVDHINARNGRQFSWSRTYFEPPHAFRVPFMDETNNWQNAERLVPAPGHTGDITLTEKLELPGKTDPDEIWLEATRRWLELQHRADRYTIIQDGHLRSAVRGDLVMASFDQLDETVFSARVKAVRTGSEGTSALVEIDECLPDEQVDNYGVRFLSIRDDGNGMAEVQSRAVAVEFLAPDLFLMGAGDEDVLPLAGDIVHVGPFASESRTLVVNRIERGENDAQILTLVDAAPQIDTQIGAMTPPLWVSRVGVEAGGSTAVPAVPVFVSIRSSIADAGAAAAISVLLRTGAGSLAFIDSFEIRHRQAGAPTWISQTVAMASGGLVITGYTSGSTVQIQARSISDAGVAGPFTLVKTIVVSSNDAPAPSELVGVTVSAALGSAQLAFGVAANTDEVRVYRKTGSTGSLDVVNDLRFALAVAPGATYNVIDGDGTRANLISNSGFASTADWTTGAGWTISGGLANKAAGTASMISQAPALAEGKAYRLQFTISARTAGSLSAGIAGASPVTGVAQASNGLKRDRVIALAGPSAIGFSADAAFAGAIDNVTVYEETALCLPQGTSRWWLQPFNKGVPGPVSGPFNATIT